MEEMRAVLETTVDPQERTLDSVVPEIQRQLDDLQTAVHNGNQKVYSKVEEIQRNVETQVGQTRSDLAGELFRVATNLAGGSSGGSWVASTAGGGSTNQAQEEGEVEQQVDEDWAKAMGHNIQVTEPETIRTIYSEYKGRAAFEEMPIEGGLEACEQKFKSKWRSHFTSSFQRRFSRMGMLCRAIDQQVEDGRLLNDVITDWDQLYVKAGQHGKSLSGLVNQLQANGGITKKGRRKKKRRQSPGVGGGGGN